MNAAKQNARHRFGKAVFVSMMLLHISPAVLANSVRDAESALRKGDAASAIRILEDAATAGDLSAKGMLASYLRIFPAPYRNTERACQLARETSDAGEPMGAVTRAECLMAGVEKAELPFALARELARKAWKSGSAAGGFTMYLVFSQDPKYTYAQDGAVNSEKYNSLAAMPVAARGEQIEALEGLAGAMRAGHVNSAIISLAYLADSSAPKNLDRIIGLASLLQRNGEQLPQRIQQISNIARDLKRFGTTHISVSAFRNAYQTALMNASIQLRIMDKNACDPKQIQLTSITADPISDAEYLPVPKPLDHTYLFRGNWNETWTFSGCEKTAPVRIAFTADGWGGVRFQSVYDPASRK